jgi:hypothetical protein
LDEDLPSDEEAESGASALMTSFVAASAVALLF